MMRASRRSLANLYKYASGISPNIYLPTATSTQINITEKEWVTIQNEAFGAPLVDYYKSRYPEVSKEDVAKIRSELRASFHFKEDWQAKYKQYNVPEEMYRIRVRLEAELDPQNIDKLKAIDTDDAQSADAYASLRIKLLQEEQKLHNEHKLLNSAKGPLAGPNVDWSSEYNNGVGTVVREKRRRYERLSAASVTWADEITTKWGQVYRQASDELQKDIDIDYLRYLENHIRDQFRAEKWYQRLAEDGEHTLTYEEVEAWMPEYYDTLMIDYDGWWELVSRGTDASQWDKFQQTDEAYQQTIQQRHAAAKSLLQGADDSVNKAFAPQSPFATFREIPKFDSSFKAAMSS
jgi:hypothetical protein